MSHLPPPLVDPRGYADFVARTEDLVELYTGGWRPAPGDPASALVRVFARMAERVADRLNRVPDRNFLAYLDLLGIELRPPQPARAPLTFFLAAGSASDALVPARTPVAGQPLEGESEPVVFETERELLVTRTTLAAVAVRDPGRDRWADYTARNDAGAWFPAFEGEVPMTHRLHLSHRAAFGAEAPKTITIRMRTESGAPFWPAMTEWSWTDAAGHHPLLQVGSQSRVREAVIEGEGQEWEVSIGDLPAVPVSTVAGFPGAWITGRLKVPLRLRATPPDAIRVDDRAVPPGEPFAPFGRTSPYVELLISAAAVFSVPGARARIDVELERPLPEAQSDLRVRWEYTTVRMGFAWAPLGLSARDREWAEEEHVDNEWEFADGTFALSRDGSVTFRVPAAWKREGDTGEMWLRARVEAGGYTGPDGPRPPVVRRVTVGYDLPVPDLAGVRVQAEHRSTEDRPPAAAFAGTTPLDLSKDVHPFGEQPRRGDAFYLAVPELAGKPDASATLTVNVADPVADEDVGAEGAAVEGRIVVASTPVPLLVWEYWSGKSGRWETLAQSGSGAAETKGFEDPSNAFTVPGEHRISLPVPGDLGEAEVNGRRDTWLRVRIARGGYGSPARYEEIDLPDGAGGTVKGWRLVPPTYRPPSLKKVSLGYEYASAWTEPDAVVTENDWSFIPVIPTESGLPPFAPFAPSSEPPAPGEAPRPRPRPILYLGFQRPGDVAGFANRTTTLFFGVGETRYGDEEDVTASGEPPALAWEYWNGAAWARLGVRDETAAFARRGMATFVGPADFRASSELGREAFWLRVRVERGGWRHPPRLERVLLNTVWAEQATRVADEVLGSGNGKPGQTFRAARAPVLAGERVEVREAEVPSAHERDDLAREAGADAVRTVAAPGGGAAEVWVRWSAVPDFHGSGPRSRHYTVDRLTGDVVFGDGTRGMVPPQGRANVRIEYRSGGGQKGNRPAGNLTQLKTTVPYVDRVTNREPAGGGAAAESLESVRRRGPRTLRHRGRAVTTADLEDLAMEASAEVAVAHAVGAATEAEAGNVRVIVVPASAAARPVPSLELLDRVETYLAERIPATVALEVVGPEWVAVDVAAEFVPEAPEIAGEAALALEARLAAYLHPLTGGPERAGWPFGRRPHRSDLYAVAEATPGVDHLLRLDVREATAARTPFFLVHSGTHAVTVVGSTDE